MGELAPETVELLEVWLAEHPDCAAAGNALRRTLATTRAALLRFPELVKPEAAEKTMMERPRLRLMQLALAALFALMLGGVTWTAFRLGQESGSKRTARQWVHDTTRAEISRNDGPWARYALAFNRGGRLSVIRRDNKPQP